MPHVPRAMCSTPGSTPDTLGPPASGVAQPWQDTAAYKVNTKHLDLDRFHAPMEGRRAYLPRAACQRLLSQGGSTPRGQIGSSAASLYASDIIHGRPTGWSPSLTSPTPHRSPHSQVAVVSPSGLIRLCLPMRPVPVWMPPD